MVGFTIVFIVVEERELAEGLMVVLYTDLELLGLAEVDATAPELVAIADEVGSTEVDDAASTTELTELATGLLDVAGAATELAAAGVEDAASETTELAAPAEAPPGPETDVVRSPLSM